MNKVLAVIAVVSIFSTPAFGGSQSFWCDTSLIDTGLTKPQVLRRCGEPDWVEERFGRILQPFYYGYGRWTYRSVPVFIEEWTYNLGPTQFMRILQFRNGRVADIELGDYGY